MVSDPKAKDDPIEAIGVFVTGTTDTGPVSPKENMAGGFVILAAIMFEVETVGSTVDLLITFVTELLVVLCALKEKPLCKDEPLKLKPAEVGIVDTLCEVLAGSEVVCEGEKEAVYGGGNELVSDWVVLAGSVVTFVVEIEKVGTVAKDVDPGFPKVNGNPPATVLEVVVTAGGRES